MPVPSQRKGFIFCFYPDSTDCKHEVLTKRKQSAVSDQVLQSVSNQQKFPFAISGCENKQKSLSAF